MVNNSEKLNLFNIFLFVLLLSQMIISHKLNSYRFPVYIEALPIDSILPLMPVFAIVYFSVCPLFLFTLLLGLWKVDNLKFAEFLFALVMLLSISNLINSLFPTLNVIRPESFDAGFLSPLVRYLYFIIPPYSTFPSMACVLATTCGFFCFRNKMRFSYLIYIWSALICISTIFTKMNYVLDLLGSVPLAISSYIFAEIAYSKFFPQNS